MTTPAFPRVPAFLKRFGPAVLLASLLALVSGCASLMSSVTNQLADDLSTTILNSDDPQTVREGVPAYLLLIDSFLESNPDDETLLLAAATLNGSFTAFVEEDRASGLATKALRYAHHAVCVRDAQWCNLQTLPFAEYERRIAGLEDEDIGTFYTLATTWAGWIQANSGDWGAVGQLARVRTLMERLLELDETYENGGAHLYMGALDTLLPASMGGRPEEGREHFERSIELSGGRYLMTRVIYAEQYARLVFDKALHDRLLNEVLAADPKVPGLTLVNVLAQQRARVLLAESDEYF